MDDEGWFEEQFALALQDLDPLSTTGLGPLSLWGADVKTALKRDDVTGEYDPVRVEMLKRFVKMRMQTPDQPDPILVFVKPEPHKVAKIEEGRLRLISAVGIIDTMVDRVMFRWLQQAALSAVGRTPAMIGWSPYYGGYRFLTQRYHRRRTLAADKSCWDWTVQGWLLVLVKDLIKRLAVQHPGWWSEWVDRRWEALFRDAEFGFRDGLRVKQPGWGVMKSGCYLTLLINSVSQAVLHSIATRRLGISANWKYFHCMGDDTLQESIYQLEDYLRELRSLGAIIKVANESDVVQFCGHEMKGLSLIPSYKNKHIFSALHALPQVLPSVLQAYQAAYSMDPTMWKWLTASLMVVAPELHLPLSRTQMWLHG